VTKKAADRKTKMHCYGPHFCPNSGLGIGNEGAEGQPELGSESAANAVIFFLLLF